MTSPGRKLARSALGSQCFTAIVLILITLATGTKSDVVSVALGAAISIVPTLAFALFAFRYAGASKNHLVSKSFSQGAKLKLVLTMFLFVVAFAGFKAHPLGVFLSYAATSASYALALFWFSKK